ncbi:hypothetical protein AC579_2137 [Pseudocercospora musae]|uniref:Uncharacterized protein n=1 Tax=Pseudocercospora musae TaxID=113226 RepID=A0A139I3H8_9PEZI|nr:hypothetical protein AC579_2137 [Pseudocercospora musae]
MRREDSRRAFGLQLGLTPSLESIDKGRRAKRARAEHVKDGEQSEQSRSLRENQTMDMLMNPTLDNWLDDSNFVPPHEKPAQKSALAAHYHSVTDRSQAPSGPIRNLTSPGQPNSLTKVCKRSTFMRPGLHAQSPSERQRPLHTPVDIQLQLY